MGAGLVDGRLLHIDSTTLKANASRNSVIESSPESGGRLAAQGRREQAGKLELFPPVGEALKVESSGPTAELPAVTPPAQPAAPAAEENLSKRQKAQVNRTHVSLTDPEAHLALCKNGVTDYEAVYQDHPSWMTRTE